MGKETELKKIASAATAAAPVAKKKRSTRGTSTGSKKATKKPVATKGPRATTIPSGEIARRAYFISEKRTREGLPGDERQDWLEAEKQLAAELKLQKNGSKKSSAA